jgi:hypothetical protein
VTSPSGWADDTSDAVPRRALLLVPVADAALAAGLLRLTSVDAQIVPTDMGPVAVLAKAEESSAHEAARSLSDALDGATIVLLRRGPSDDPAAGDVQAVTYQRGDRLPVSSPGAMLANLPLDVEDLLLGIVDPADLPGVVDSRSLTGPAATRLLLGAVRATRKSARAARRAARRRRGTSGDRPADDAVPSFPPAGPPETGSPPGGPTPPPDGGVATPSPKEPER